MGSELIFRIAFFILLGSMLVARVYFSKRVLQAGETVMPDREAIKHEGVGLFALRAVMFFILIAVLVLYAINHPWMQALAFQLPDWLRGVGFIIGLFSVALVVWAQVDLGKQFSPQLQLRQEHHLVTSGPYARVRHPLYTGLYAFGLSMALVSANWFFVFFFVISLVGIAARVPREEQMMLEQFGDEYREYIQRTGRYVPKV